MGDRANVAIEQWRPDGARIYIYTHWDGYDLPDMLADALNTKSARARWKDDSYLTRILIDQITKSGRDEETGYGVSTYITDNSYNVLVVNPTSGTVHVENDQNVKIGEHVNFQTYIDMSPHQRRRFNLVPSTVP